MNLTQLFFNDLINNSDIRDIQKTILLKRLHGFTLEQIGQEYGVTRERIRQHEEKGIWALKVPSRLGLSYKGYKVKMFEERLGTGKYKTVTSEEMDKANIETLPIPIRIINSLVNAGITTVGQAKKRINLLWKPRNMGPKSAMIVKEALIKYYGTENL